VFYSNGILTQIGIGTNPEKSFFGEARIFAGDYINNFLGVEALGQNNLKRSEWHNISAGLMEGYYDYVEGMRMGIPVPLAIKPMESHRDLSVILEATPMESGSPLYHRELIIFPVSGRNMVRMG
jgi:hypothetical protein